MNKFFSGFSSVFLFFFLPLTVHALGIQVMVKGEAVTLIDVPQSAWFAEYVRAAAEAGIVNGYMDEQGKLTGQFGPSNPITLAEALKIAVEGAGYDEELYGSMVESGVSHWASSYVSVARAENFELLKSQSRMRWNDPATRADVASLFTSAFKVDMSDVEINSSRYKDVSLATSYSASIEALSRDEILSGDTDSAGQATGTFRPSAEINRAEVVKMVVLTRAKYAMPGAGDMPVVNDGNENEHIVLYSNSGFSPQVIRVKQGESVTFKADGPLALKVASNPHPAHSDYSAFVSKVGLKQGETYIFKFTKLGSYGYHNDLHLSHKGTVIVEE